MLSRPPGHAGRIRASGACCCPTKTAGGKTSGTSGTRWCKLGICLATAWHTPRTPSAEGGRSVGAPGMEAFRAHWLGAVSTCMWVGHACVCMSTSASLQSAPCACMHACACEAVRHALASVRGSKLTGRCCASRKAASRHWQRGALTSGAMGFEHPCH